MENNDGKRVLPKSGMPLGAKITIIAVAALLALIIGGYLGLCAFAGSNGDILPGTTVAGVDVGGLTRAQAEDKLSAANPYAARTVSVQCPEITDQIAEVSGADLEYDTSAALDAACAQGQDAAFLRRGFQYLAALLRHGPEYDVSVSWPQDPQNSANQALARLVPDVDVRDSSYELTGTHLVIHKGTSGLGIDLDAVKADVMAAFLDEDSSGVVEAQATVAPPQEPDFEAIYREVYVAPADAYLDKETKEIVPSVTGVSFDIATARALLERTDEGGVCTVALQETEPAINTEKLNENLFKDVLGQSSTKCAGPSNRWYNISLAASFVNDMILLPGETFSYNDTCGPYESSTGYKKAGAYQAGKTVDTTAGGICQLSSTIYWTTLKANLETVERNKHKYNVGYLPAGMDATVYSNSLDFKFKNNTEYPIKIEAYQDDSHYLHVTIYGTDTTGIHGEPYKIDLGTIYAETLYEANSAIPAGTTQKDPERTAYNGLKVEVHQKLVDKDGNTISDTVLYVNKYDKRDRVIFYNPADQAALGIDPATGKQTLTPVTPTPDPNASPDPNVSPDPNASPDPNVSADPNVSPTPGVSADPGVTPTPGTETPVPTPTPSGGETTPPVTETPAPTPSEAPSAEPTPTPAPLPSDIPEGIPVPPPADDGAADAAA